ncbi:MAG: hypothetical protein IJZ53_13365 [Tyzzerella sp.]|nr:hypothetical protein [Tyzzerella sp.]
MRKKKIWIPILIVFGILVFGLFIMYRYSLGITVGRCLVAVDGSYLLVDDNSPTKISNCSSNEELFSNLKTGDKILVVHDGVNESYPGQTGAYFCLRLGGGSIDDISDEVISELTELGWLKGDVEDMVLENTKRVEYSYEDKYMSLEIPEGWKYSITEYSESAYAVGISFWPEGYSEGKLSLQYFLSGFGVCGTGLTESDITLGNMKAKRGIYDGDALWSFISFIPTARDYAVINEGAEEWWQEHGDMAMAILQTIQIGGTEVQ